MDKKIILCMATVLFIFAGIGSTYGQHYVANHPGSPSVYNPFVTTYSPSPYGSGYGAAAPNYYVSETTALQPIASTRPSLANYPVGCYQSTQTPGYYPHQVAGYPSRFACRPVLSDRRVGRGILGRPKVYVAGQPIRNILRWITP